MRVLAMPLAAAAAVVLLPAAAATPSLEAAGWRHAEWHGIAPATWRPQGDGVAVQGHSQASFVWRPVQGRAACLTWRWRVDHGPPGTDLTRRGSDRALAVSVGFSGWPSRVTLWQRTQHMAAQGAAGDHVLPRSVLTYAWGGTGREPQFFASPYMSGLGSVRVLQTAAAPRGEWRQERVDLAADWRAAFGADPPPLQEIAIGTDVDNTGSPIAAAVEGLRLIPCH